MQNEFDIIAPNAKLVKQLSQELRCSELFAHLLVSRGLTGAAEARSFLQSPLSAINLDNCLIDMDKAVARIARALQAREHIMVFGDYDVDGITSTFVLGHFLKFGCGGRVSHYIPHRVDEGYGLYPHHIENFAEKPHLIITVDCGASSVEAIKCAKKAGIDVIVTDHHRVDEDIDCAYANVNPKRPGCKSGKTYLCGVGIVFLLLIHLRRYLRKIDFWEGSTKVPNLKQYCDAVALGTIADVSPLVGENRVFVKAGLEMLNQSPRLGLKALIAQNCTGDSIDTQTAAFRLIPVLNAAGRMRHADYAFDLLRCEDEASAQKLTMELLKLNRQRQSLEQETMQVILRALEKDPRPLDKKALVVHGDGWHEGLLGILAARLMERFNKPTLVLSKREDGSWKGSGRAPGYLDLFQSINACGHLLSNYGGHKLAAGLSMPGDNLETFKEAFEAALTGCEPTTARVRVDAEVTLKQVGNGFAKELTGLEPFGSNNPEPVFLARNVEVNDSRPIGSKNNHLKLRLSQNGGPVMDAVHFNYDKMLRPGGKIENLLFNLRLNTWQGQTKAQIIVIKGISRN